MQKVTLKYTRPGAREFGAKVQRKFDAYDSKGRQFGASVQPFSVIYEEVETEVWVYASAVRSKTKRVLLDISAGRLTMTREEWLMAFTNAARAKFEEAGAPIPETVRCSIGFPSKGQRSKVVGECWSAASSADGVCEIFIRPNMHADAAEILGTLTHELIHAAVGHEAKHGPLFKRPAKALGLEGKMTATVVGDGWREWALPILEQIGDYPGAELYGSAMVVGGPKPQKNRQLKLQCDTCGFTCRASRGMIDKVEGALHCPDYECGGILEEK